MGLGFRLSGIIVDAAEGSIVFLSILVMASSFVLGMGMPTVAAYILTITLVAPALVDVGVTPITAHFLSFTAPCSRISRHRLRWPVLLPAR